MLMGIPVEGIIAIMGHDRGTKTKELVECLQFLGELVAPRLKPVKSNVPEKAIMVVRPEQKTGGHWHWIVVQGGIAYDSIYPSELPLKDYLQINRFKATSYLEIKS